MRIAMNPSDQVGRVRVGDLPQRAARRLAEQGE
jgi:hypothetical protein